MIIESPQRVSSDVMRGRCSSSEVATSDAPFGENGHMSTSDAQTASAQMKGTPGTAPEAASGTANVTSAASVPLVDANAETSPATTHNASAVRTGGSTAFAVSLRRSTAPVVRSTATYVMIPQISTTVAQSIFMTPALPPAGSTNASTAPNEKHNTPTSRSSPVNELTTSVAINATMNTAVAI